MRTSRFAIATCTALLGLGTLVSQAVPSAVAPPPQQGTIVLNPNGGSIDDYAPSPPTTKPAPKADFDYGDFDLVNPGPVDPPDQPDAPDFDLEADQGSSVQDPTGPEDGECNPGGSTIDPDCLPCTPVPGGPECPGEEPCVPDSTVPGTPDEQCPDPCDPLTEDCDPCEPNGPSAARSFDDEDCDPCRPQNDGPNLRSHDECDPCEDDDVVRHLEDCDPCEDRPDAPKRDRGEDCDPCRPEGDTGGGNAVRHGDPECPGEGTTGGDDGGTDGPDRGRLPHTGGDIAVFVGAGLGLTGLGTLLRRIGRR